MQKIIILVFGLVAVAHSIRVRSKTNEITQQNTDLFKYSPSDEYTLSEDVDDGDKDKPPIIYTGDAKAAKVEQLQNLNAGQGKFKLNVKTQNGIELQQAGRLKDNKTFVVSGSYAFTGADGRRYRTRYTADEFGYHPITELDIEIPDPDVPTGGQKAAPQLGGLGNRNDFKFLQKDLKGKVSKTGSANTKYSGNNKGGNVGGNVGGNIGGNVGGNGGGNGSGNSGINGGANNANLKNKYEDHSETGYDYKKPGVPFPSNQVPQSYLPPL